MQDLRQQLAPGWTPVNIGIMVVLFIMSWPLALLMIAYIIWGNRLGIDLGRPDTLALFWRRLVVAIRAGVDSFSRHS